MMFSGLGDQYGNMGRGLYRSRPVFRAEVDRCCEILLPSLGRDLREVMFSGAEPVAVPSGTLDLRRMLGRERDPHEQAPREIDRLPCAHVALFVVEYALARLWESLGVKADAMIGFSLGEYVAACLADVLTLDDALALVTERAHLIAALPAGAMLAVPLSAEALEPLLNEDLAVAVRCTPAVTILGGTPDAIRALEETLQARAIVCRRLRASHAFHTRFLASILEPLRERVARVTLRPPQRRYLSNLSGTWITEEQATDAASWARHTGETVRFAEGVAELLREPGRVFLEVGPGLSLGSFVLQHPDRRRQSNTMVLASLRHANDGQADDAVLLHTVGRLWMAGVDLRLPIL